VHAHTTPNDQHHHIREWPHQDSATNLATACSQPDRGLFVLEVEFLSRKLNSMCRVNTPSTRKSHPHVVLSGQRRVISRPRTACHAKRRKRGLLVESIFKAFRGKGEEIPATDAGVLTRPSKEELALKEVRNVFSYRNELKKR
jgi:hypothetical protein